jgi:hypothetical protein
VKNLREALMRDDFMMLGRRLMHASQIDVGYFAAGIIAHLASDGPQAWLVGHPEREELLEELVSLLQLYLCGDVSRHCFVDLLIMPVTIKLRGGRMYTGFRVLSVCRHNLVCSRILYLFVNALSLEENSPPIYAFSLLTNIPILII